MKLILTAVLAFQALLAQQPAAGPPLPAQTIGPNDLVSVAVYDAPEFTRTVRVGADGGIRLPMLKQPIPAAGLMPAGLETAIAAALKAQDILVDPFVTVSVVEYESRPISVAGAVRSPVTFQAASPTSLLEAITRAGGLSPEAGSDILVSYTQPGPDAKPVVLTRRIPVKSLIDAADPEVNVKLNGGEEIRVPEAGKIFVVGNVRRPGAFPVPDDSETTILKAIALAEGLERFARKEAYILRRDDRTGARNEIPVPLQQIMKRKSPDLPLLAGDVLYIPDNSGRRAAMNALDRVLGFGAATASGVIIWSGR